MLKFVVFLLLGLAAANGEGLKSRIVGGTKAPEGRYPYQVELIYSGRFICGGSIIGTRYILTAAHCVENQKASSMKVLVGTNTLDDLEEGTLYSAEALIVHPKFSMKFIVKNDIAVIRLTEEITYTSKVQPIKLPTSDYKDYSRPVILTGWGRTGASEPPATKLQHIQLKVISSLRCKIRWILVNKDHLCTLTQTGEGACNGDSGSPLVDQTGEQIGIVSFGMPCARGIPDVFTRVYSFVSWIKQQIRE